MNTFFNTIMSPGICSGVGISIICTLGPLNDRDDSAVIHFLYSNKEVLCLFCLLWIAFSFILDSLLKKKDDKIALLKEENAGLQKVIQQKNEQLNETHKILYNRYGEFARFANGVRFEEILKQFVDKKTIVDSAQIYRITRNKEYSRIVITLNHVKGYCKAGLDINSLLQTNFVLKYDVYKMFRRGVFRKWNRLKYEDLKSWEAAELYNEISVTAKEIASIIMKRMRKIDCVGIVEDNDFSYYRLLSILSLILMGGDGIITFDEVSMDKEINRYLRGGKRTGVLGAVLLEDIFIFSHKGESKKNGRMYVSFYFEDMGNPYVTIFSFTPSNLSEKLGFKEEILELVDDFKSVLNEGRITNVYNDHR